MKPRDLAQLSIHDTLDLESDGFAMLLPGGSSPLSLLSPNSGGIKARSPSTAKPGSSVAPPPAALPSVGEDEEENEPLGALPQLGRGGRARGGGSRRPDPRRQSLAISQLFAGLSEGAGLLGERELAVGDEDIQVPLARSGRLLGGAANHSSLFCEPDTGDLLDTDLPSPLLQAGAAASAGADQAAAATPAWCDSPAAAPAPRGTASVRRTPAMRASMAVFGDLSRACQEQGLDDFDGDDFQLQESSKVKELAFLFKMEGATPRTSVEASGLSDTSSGTARASADLGASNNALHGIRQRLQQLHADASSLPEAAEQHQDKQQEQQQVGQQQALADAATATPRRQQQGQPGAAPTPVPVVPSQPVAPSAASSQLRSAAKAGAKPSASKPAAPARALTAGAAAAQRASSKLPGPPARASRLRPPSSSSSFFSCAATASRQPERATAAATKAGGAAAAAAARSTNGRVRPASQPRSAGGSASAATCMRTQGAAAPAASTSASKPPALPQLAQGSSRIPTPSKPGAAPRAEKVAQPQHSSMFSQRTLNAAAARQQRTTAVSRTSAAAAASSAHGTPAQGPVGTAPAAAGPAANLTPTTARLRLLEQHPELAFGGGTKLAPSPACQADQSRKMTAEERHLQEWADHL